MAAMMLPALIPAARATASFVAGYLAVWTAAGLAAYSGFELVRGLDAAFLAWDRAGRYLAAGAVLAAAAYQLTPAKGACLDRCRTAGGHGLSAGIQRGVSCVGCCAGLMAALFALGVMSLTWMVVVAALIAVERLLPWRTPALYGVAAALAILGIWIALAPGELPGLTLPGGMTGM
jgi:predicted metal-binding membrane protein